jgi:hypothetical protein
MERKDEAFGREVETSLYNCEITSSIHSIFGIPFTRERMDQQSMHIVGFAAWYLHPQFTNTKTASNDPNTSLLY